MGGEISILHAGLSTAEARDGFAKIDMTVTRNNLINIPEINNIYKDPWHPKMSTDHSYIYSFHNNSLPPRYHLSRLN